MCWDGQAGPGVTQVSAPTQDCPLGLSAQDVSLERGLFMARTSVYNINRLLNENIMLLKEMFTSGLFYMGLNPMKLPAFGFCMDQSWQLHGVQPSSYGN